MKGSRRALAIVTKDADFFHRIMLSQPLPWVVHLRFGKEELHNAKWVGLSKESK